MGLEAIRAVVHYKKCGNFPGGFSDQLSRIALLLAEGDVANEFFVGRAGFLAALLFLRFIFNLRHSISMIFRSFLALPYRVTDRKRSFLLLTDQTLKKKKKGQAHFFEHGHLRKSGRLKSLSE